MNVDVTQFAVTESKPEPSPASTPTSKILSQISPINLATLVVVIAALGWSYEPNFRFLLQAWDQPDYTHGYLVLPIALIILWKRWKVAREVELAPWWPAWSLVILGLAARWFFHERSQNWSEAATMMPVLIGLVMARLGWRFVWKVWPAFGFLLFLYPLPPQLNTALSQPLQSLATSCACALLKFTGLWVMPEGNIILVGNEKLEVAAACNGLSMLMSLAATVAAAAALFPMTIFKRIALLFSIIPIALGSNVLRITATAWCYYKLGSETGKHYAHDFAGILMMPTAMILVGIELKLISWVVIENDDESDDEKGGRMSLNLVTQATRPEPEVRP